MSDKSYVTMEQHVCLVCGKTFDTGAILMDRRLLPRFERNTVTGNSLCPEDKALFDDGYVALVEIDPAKSKGSEGDTILPENAWRTGKVLHLKREAWSRVFNTEIPATIPLVYIDPDGAARLEAMMPKNGASDE